MTIRWQPDAVEEVEAIAAFSHEKQQGLEQRFLEFVEDAIRRIGRRPQMY